MAKELSKEAFKQLYDQWYLPIRNFIYFKTGDVDLTDDLLQDVFVKLWETRHKIRRETVKSYLYTIANHLTINQLKKQQTQFRFIARQDHQAQNNESPEFAMETKELDAALQKALAQLPEKNRVVLLMHKMEGHSYKEIAERLGISQKAVEKRMHKAREQLKKHVSLSF